MLGTTIGNYAIEKKIGEGGMGAVFLARHTMLGRPVAVKVLLPELSRNREIVGRFFNEARAAASIRHPGIVEVFDFGYMPSVIRIKAGQTVVWQNGGRELHDVTGDDWHSGPIEPSTEFRYTFGLEGAFNYRCSVHPDMRGTVIVTS